MYNQRGQWSSKFGFIMAGAGSAIGLGNVWRFPYIAGENGGAAFVLVYLLVVLLMGLPYMIAELALGRATQRNPVGAILAIKPGSNWKWVGVLGVITGLGILSFYSVIAGWTLGYIFKTGVAATAGTGLNFQEFVADPWAEILLFALFMFLTAIIVYGGIEHGIERWSKILLPLLFLILFGLIIYAVSLPGALKGVSFYLSPDFSKISGRTFLAALGQAFFSLSLGMGLMITYGSYLSKKDDMILSAIYISLFDTLAAFMAGLIIFPALFSMGESPAMGPKLVFVILPKLFAQMPGGMIVGPFFFILLAIAALTSTISLLEVPVAYLVDEKKYHRKKIVWIAALVTFILGIPAALSQGASEVFTNMQILPANLSPADILSQMSFLFGDLALVIGGLLLSVFVGWIWKADKASEEIQQGSQLFLKIRKVWIFLIKYFLPAVILIILLNLFGVFK
jgi:NSS family neurotransmitter:Na+ symporter